MVCQRRFVTRVIHTSMPKVRPQAVLERRRAVPEAVPGRQPGRAVQAVLQVPALLQGRQLLDQPRVQREQPLRGRPLRRRCGLSLRSVRTIVRVLQPRVCPHCLPYPSACPVLMPLPTPLSSSYMNLTYSAFATAGPYSNAPHRNAEHCNHDAVLDPGHSRHPLARPDPSSVPQVGLLAYLKPFFF